MKKGVMKVSNKVISVDIIVKKLMAYYNLNQEQFAEKFKVDKSQVTRWLNKNQVPRGELYVQLKDEYNKIKDEELPLFKNIQ